jgi:23S rRNA (guanosine2251-2'-O)-methyltransferase
MNDVIFGRNAVIQGFEAGIEMEKVFLLSSLSGEFEIKIRNFCKSKNIPLAKVPEIKLNELSKFKVHQGIVAIISPIKFYDYQDLIASIIANGKDPLVVVLDAVTDVRNIGAIARSAYFFGVDCIILSGNFSGHISDDIVKSSAGAILKLPIARAGSLLTLVSDLQNIGLKVIASGLKSSVSLEDADLSGPMAIVLGSEDKGLHYKVLEQADTVLKIKNENDFDSLNVSVAAGILLYECQRSKNK